MLKKNLCGLFAALFAAGFAGCGGGPRTYTVVDGTMLGTTLHVVADVEGKFFRGSSTGCGSIFT